MEQLRGAPHHQGGGDKELMRRLGDRGMSFVDLLVGSAVGLMIAAGAVTVVRSQTLAMRTGAGQLDMNDAARGVVEFMAREIRMAGYNPRCLNPSPVTAVVAAGPQTLRVQYDLNENGVLDTSAAASEDVLYQYDTESRSLRRTVGGEAGVLAADVPAEGFRIRYFDQNGVELIGTGPGGALTAGQTALVRRVSLRFEPSKAADARISNTVRASLWTNVLLRNRQYACQ